MYFKGNLIEPEADILPGEVIVGDIDHLLPPGIHFLHHGGGEYVLRPEDGLVEPECNLLEKYTTQYKNNLM